MTELNVLYFFCLQQNEAEALAAQQHLVFFEFEELLVSLAMLLKPAPRWPCFQAVELLFEG